MHTTCLKDEILADYMEGRLSEEERFEVEDHLSSCEHCLEEFVVANRVFQEDEASELDAVPVHVTQSAVRLVQGSDAESCPSLSERLVRSVESFSQKVSDVLTFRPWTGMQLEPIRGSKTRLAKDLIQLRKKFRDFEAEIEVEKTGEEKAHIRVKMVGPRKEDKPVRVTLVKGGREVASHLMAGAQVLFEDVPFGRYGLFFSRDGAELGEYHFEITENRHGEG